VSLQKRPRVVIQKKLDKFVPLIKVTETPTGQLIAAGRVTAEEVDRDNEICDYIKSKPMFADWSQEQFDATSKAGQEPSYGNIRLQHSLQIAGRVIQPLDFDDQQKAISVTTTPATGEIANWLRQGVLTGFSMGGSYAERKCRDCKTDIPGDGNFCPKCHKDVIVKFVARPSEISFVDRPALKSAHFSYVKADGTE
jgi:RNA polymerase subunit RPABC4/transcription elongation factor Spt4